MLTPGVWQEEMGRDAQAEETRGRTLLRQQSRKVSLLKVLGSEETQVAKEMIVPQMGTPWVALYLWSGPMGLDANEFTHVQLVSVSGGTRVEVSGPHTTKRSLRSPGAYQTESRGF